MSNFTPVLTRVQVRDFTATANLLLLSHTAGDSTSYEVVVESLRGIVTTRHTDCFLTAAALYREELERGGE